MNDRKTTRTEAVYLLAFLLVEWERRGLPGLSVCGTVLRGIW